MNWAEIGGARERGARRGCEKFEMVRASGNKINKNNPLFLNWPTSDGKYLYEQDGRQEGYSHYRSINKR